MENLLLEEIKLHRDYYNKTKYGKYATFIQYVFGIYPLYKDNETGKCFIG
jgi:hypothetical protein